MSQSLIISQVLLWIGFLSLTVVVIALLRQVGVLFERVAPAGALSMNSSLKAGDAAPQFSLPSLEGSIVDIGGKSNDRKDTFLFFLSSDCPICKELLPALMSFAKHERDTMKVLFAGSEQEDKHKETAAALSLPLSSYVVSDQLGMTYAVSKLPYAVLIDSEGKIASFGLVNNREHLESLLEAKDKNVASIQEYYQKSA